MDEEFIRLYRLLDNESKEYINQLIEEIINEAECEKCKNNA